MRFLLLSAPLIFLAAFAAGFVADREEQEEAAGTYGSLRQELESVLESEGTEAARLHFQEVFRSAQDRSSFHALAHWLGSEYYLREGSSGIARCDETAGFGCFHGFYGMAFAAEQERFLDNAKEFCSDTEDRVRFAECIHGIGHGILVNVGHKEEMLPSALEACSRLGLDFFHERMCTSGVFMEYNLRSLESFKEPSIRSFHADRPYDPCPKLEVPFDAVCYHDLPYWWVPAFGGDLGELGELCQRVQDAKNREHCFRGLGKIAPWATEYQMEKTAGACQGMPDEKSAAWCTEEALFVLLYKGEAGALQFCETLQGPSLISFCREQGEAFACDVLGECL